jgi:hypothetical protein
VTFDVPTYANQVASYLYRISVEAAYDGNRSLALGTYVLLLPNETLSDFERHSRSLGASHDAQEADDHCMVASRRAARSFLALPGTRDQFLEQLTHGLEAR